jgi:hypothetical protein
MRNIFLALFFFISCTAYGADRELTLARSALEDAILRDDAEGMRLARGRLALVAADSPTAETHYLIGLAAFFESTNAWRDAKESARLIALGIRHADRALELDRDFADALMLSSALRFYGMRAGISTDPKEMSVRRVRATDLGPTAPFVSYINGITSSMNPAGPARPEGIRAFDEMAQRSRGFWKLQAEAWRLIVRTAADEPDIERLRPMAAQLFAEDPQFELAKSMVDFVVPRRFAAVPDVKWQPLLTDAPNDGIVATRPDVISVDRADAANRVWFRVRFRERVPSSAGVNIVVNRSGDAYSGMRWWGQGSTFRFDRLVTAWIVREGDGFYGRLGVTDEDGARAVRFSKLSDDVQVAVADDTMIVSVPRDTLGLTEKSTIVVASGSHFVWNDDATSVANSR